MLIKIIAKNWIFLRQFILYFILLLIITSTIGLLLYYTAYDIITDLSERFYVTMHHEIKNNIDSWLQDISNLNIQLFGTHWFQKIMYMQPHIDPDRIKVFDFMNISRELANYKSVNNFIEDIFIYFRNDKIILSSYGRDNMYYFFDNLLKFESNQGIDIKKIMDENNKARLITNLDIDSFGRKYPAIIYVQSYSTSETSPNATIVTVIKREKIDKILSNLKTQTNYNIFIVDDEGNIITGNTNGIWFENTNSTAITDLNDVKANNVTYKTIQGQDYFIYKAESSICKWSYIAAVPMDSILNRAIKFRNFFIKVFVFSLSLGILVLVLMTHKFLDPLKRIIESIDIFNEARYQSKGADFDMIERNISKLLAERNMLIAEIKRHQPVIKNNLLLKLVQDNSIDNEYLFRALNEVNVCFPNIYYCIIMYEIEYMPRCNINDSNVQEINVVITEIFNKIMNDLNLICYTISIDNSKIAFLININDDTLIAPASSFVNTLKRINDETEKSYNISISVGIGGMYDSVQMVGRSFREARQVLNYKILIGKSRVIYHSDINYQKQCSYYYPTEKEFKLIQYLRLADYEKIESIIDEVIHENIHNQEPNLVVARCLFYDMQATALKSLEELSLPFYTNEIITYDLESLYTFSEMVSCIKEIYKKICMLITQRKTDFSINLIEGILKDINMNYSDSNFSLGTLSEKYDVSKSYISIFFKEQTGMYFSEYLNKKRLEEAKKLLTNSDKTVKDIAVEVGYINDISFRRIFKRYELTTPGQYREQKE